MILITQKSVLCIISILTNVNFEINILSFFSSEQRIDVISFPNLVAIDL